MQRILGGSLLSAVLALGAIAGCASEPDVDPGSDILMGEDLLVSIPRELDATTAARKRETMARFVGGDRLRSGPSTDFYLAVRKSALNERWFWAVYLKELQPYGPSPGTLGTHVVRFREQNGKLFVFDADNRRATSDIFNPDLIIDAFPIVESNHFNSLPGSGGYLLIDPAAGLNRYSALSDWYATDPFPITLTTELSFVENFKSSSDGGHYEQIITAYENLGIGDPGDQDTNEYRTAATLGHTIRRYTESPTYTAVPAPPVTHYFLTDPFSVPGTSGFAQNAVHWGFHPGMQPIKWRIGREILDLQADPSLGGANLFEAIKKGIESWNALFGYPVFSASLASPSDSFADDHVNYFIVDPDPSKGFAYADWRTNPNTGEIRGASVYFGAGFFGPFPDDPTSLAAPAKPKTRRPTLAWQGKVQEPLCVRWAPAWEPHRGRGETSGGVKMLTGPEKLERYIQEVAAHEIGHTLGLRHNFKGSLVPPTSSVMEYNQSNEAIAQPTPGAYDAQAIAFLYGQTPSLPTLPFCNDGDTLVDPNCVRFDPGTPDPLTDYQIADYVAVRDLILDGTFPLEFVELLVQIIGTELYAYARTGTPAEAAAAWHTALDRVRAPISPAELAANPLLGPVADALAAAVFTEILIDPQAAISVPFSNPAIIAAIASDGKGILANLDGVRSYATRRIVVDALKLAQTTDAYLALTGARDLIAAQLPALGPIDQALTRDLLARIDGAITPYFD